MRESPDPEIAATLIRRAAIFKIVTRMQDAGDTVSPESIKNSMRSEAENGFKTADYAWVDTTLARRLSP